MKAGSKRYVRLRGERLKLQSLYIILNLYIGLLSIVMVRIRRHQDNRAQFRCGPASENGNEEDPEELRLGVGHRIHQAD